MYIFHTWTSGRSKKGLHIPYINKKTEGDSGMEHKELLQHFADHYEIYKYLIGKKRTEKEVISHLIDGKILSKTTTFRHLEKIKNGEHGMLDIDEDIFGFDKNKLDAIISKTYRDFGIQPDGIQGELIEKMETEISQLQSEKKNYENVIVQQLKEIEKLNKHISVLKDNYDKSIRKYINEKMERKVVFASNVSYEPKPDVDDRLFLGEVPVEININKSISKYGGERISFYDTTEVKVQESDKQLNEQNYKSRIIRSIMGSSFFRNWSREQEEQKQFMEENGLKSKKVIAKQRDYEKLSDEATPIQKRIYESIEKCKCHKKNHGR